MAVHGQENSCEGERPRALLLPPISSELLARIRGQTHDLCWQLVLVQTSEADEEGVGMEQRASRAARDHDALVVM